VVDPTNAIVDYNLYYTIPGPVGIYPSGKIISYNGISYDMSEWESFKSASGFESNSPDPQNPEFVSTVHPINLDLRATSPARGTGNPGNIGANWDSIPFVDKIPANTEPPLVDQSQLIVYPNPTEDIINIVLSGVTNSAQVKIEVFDVAGKLLILENFFKKIDLIRIPIKLSSGIYPLKVSSGKIVKSALIVIK